MTAREKLRELAVREEGQSMVFGAISMFALACFIALVFNIGDVTAKKVRLQNAADSAAYSGAQVQANSLNTIAWINDGMTFTYYNLMRFAVDYISYGVLDKMKRHRPFQPYIPFPPPFSAGRTPPDQVVGVQNAPQKFANAEAIAQEWIPRGEDWLFKLSKVERGIIRITPWLVKKEVVDMARLNGADGVCMYPDPETNYFNNYFKQETRKRFTVDMQKRWIRKWGGLPDNRAFFPSLQWWDMEEGQTRNFPGEYSQIRTCWHRMDNQHRNNPPTHSGLWSHGVQTPQNLARNPFPGQAGGAPNQELPAGHWHHLHIHYIDTPFGPVPVPPFPHDVGHMEGGHPPFTGPPDPRPEHHNVTICPTCGNWDSMNALVYLDGKTDVMKHQSQVANVDRYGRVRLSNFPMVLNGDRIFTEGIHVMVWMKPKAAPIIGGLFKATNHGYFALAGAQLGIRRGGSFIDVQNVSDATGNNRNNLYDDIEFGARLVALQDAGGARVLGQLERVPWYSEPGRPDNGMTREAQQALSNMKPKTGNQNFNLRSLYQLIQH